MTAPILILGYGNPARGDDALGPMVADWAEDWVAQQSLQDRIDVLCVLQLNPEHAYDLEGRQQLIFVDAACQQTEPCCWRALEATAPGPWVSHSSSPASLLWYYQELLGRTPPEAWILSLQGTDFELGQPLSAQGQASFQLACQRLQTHLMPAQATHSSACD